MTEKFKQLAEEHNLDPQKLWDDIEGRLASKIINHLLLHGDGSPGLTLNEDEKKAADLLYAEGLKLDEETVKHIEEVENHSIGFNYKKEIKPYQLEALSRMRTDYAKAKAGETVSVILGDKDGNLYGTMKDGKFAGIDGKLTDEHGNPISFDRLLAIYGEPDNTGTIIMPGAFNHNKVEDLIDFKQVTAAGLTVANSFDVIDAAMKQIKSLNFAPSYVVYSIDSQVYKNNNLIKRLYAKAKY